MLRVALFSPLTPLRSGIADYAEELLPFLARGAEIDVFVDGFKPANTELISSFRTFDYRADPSVIERLRDYDAVLYHMGNDHRYHSGIYRVAHGHPGIVVLHDFSLQHFFSGIAHNEPDGTGLYLDELEAASGYSERLIANGFFDRNLMPPHSHEPLRYPLNYRLANRAEGVIVHSEWSRDRLQKIAPSTPIRRVPHYVTPLAGASPGESSDAVRIASFGFINPEKGIERVLRVLAKLRDRLDFQYRLVGEINPHFDVRTIVRDLGLDDRVEITGFVTLEEFVAHVSNTDIAINLREQTVGETSGSLCRILSAGVASIVSDEGWYSELPGDCAVKIDMRECTDALLEAYLERLIVDPALRSQIGNNAKRYMTDNHSIEVCSDAYLEFLEEIAAKRSTRRFFRSVAADVADLGMPESASATLLPEIAREVATLVRNGNGTPKREPAGITPFEKEIVPVTRPSVATTSGTNEEPGRLRRVEGLDYAAGALRYTSRISEERRHHLYTKPFYNLANKPEKYAGAGIDADSHRHFCDFANMAMTLALLPGSRVLDVGCGSGWLSEYFARFGYDVTGVDISPDLIEMSRERLRKVPFGVDHETDVKCRFEVLNIEREALDEEFDAVICYDSLHHFVDERGTLKNLARMTKRGGILFILEGDKPPDDSAAAGELRGVMEEFATLESPFDPRYLKRLLDENGFAVVGDYVSVNGLFPREFLEEADRLPIQVEPLNYLLCKKVSIDLPASSVPNSRQPNILSARLTLRNARDAVLVSRPAEVIRIAMEIENTGDTLWLLDREARRGAVMVGAKVFDSDRRLVHEVHSAPSLPGGAFAPGEKTQIVVTYTAPEQPGRYALEIDLVCQEISWFNANDGTKPLTIELEVG